jgi:hypothetical protein
MPLVLGQENDITFPFCQNVLLKHLPINVRQMLTQIKHSAVRTGATSAPPMGNLRSRQSAGARLSGIAREVA